MLVNTQHMRCCLVLQFEVKLYTSQQNLGQQLLGY